MVVEFAEAHASGMTRTAFCKLNPIPRPSLQNWGRIKDKLVFAASLHMREEPGIVAIPSLAPTTTVGGSGRVSKTAPMKDALLVFIKDERRLKDTVTLEAIVHAAVELVPDTLAAHSDESKMSWCRRF